MAGMTNECCTSRPIESNERENKYTVPPKIQDVADAWNTCEIEWNLDIFETARYDVRQKDTLFTKTQCKQTRYFHSD